MKDCVIVVSLDPGKDKDPSLFFLRVLFACTFLSPDYHNYMFICVNACSAYYLCVCVHVKVSSDAAIPSLMHSELIKYLFK